MRATPSAVRADPNVTPMIDVMLVLLIIFMTIGPMLTTGYPVTPPVGMHLTAHPEEHADAVIGLDASGHLFYEKTPVDSATLRMRLASRFAAAPDDRVVYLRADARLPYERVQTVMELASSSGARVVGLVAAQTPARSGP